MIWQGGRPAACQVRSMLRVRAFAVRERARGDSVAGGVAGGSRLSQAVVGAGAGGMQGQWLEGQEAGQGVRHAEGNMATCAGDGLRKWFQAYSRLIVLSFSDD